MGALSVAGIDPSSKKIAIVETRKNKKNKPYIHTVELRNELIESNLRQAFEFIDNFCQGVIERDGQPPLLFLEAPVMGIGGPGATIPQAYVSGSIMAGASNNNAKIKLVNNQTWKKRVLGNGSTPKDAIGPWVKENWSELYTKAPVMKTGPFKGRPDQDILDAGCINLFGWKWISTFEILLARKGRPQ